jgi:hypothetical protein
MPGNLKPRAIVKQIEDPEWYRQAYLRAAGRFSQEEKRGNAKNMERLARRLQALYEQIVRDLENDPKKDAKAKAAATAINHAVSDHRLPRILLRPYEGVGH